MRSNNIGKLPVMIIAIALASILLLGGVAAFVLKPGGHKKAEAKEKPVSVSLGEFVVNLADSGEVRYLKTNIVLGVRGEMAKGGGEGHEGGAATDPQIRDAVIEVLSSKHFSELIKPGGKDTLRQDIIAAVNKRIEGSEVADVYFSEFAMQ